MLICESSQLEDYLSESEEVDFRHEVIQRAVKQLFHERMAEIDRVRKAYEYVRDQIAHSWDIQSNRITRTASEALMYKEGICYAKSNLLAALLRAQRIPAGFCYQRLTLGDTPESGYCIHALNAVYLTEWKKWVRLDARGNKEGIHAEFSIHNEKLAFPVRSGFDEYDYPTIYTRPNRKTMDVLLSNDDCMYMYLNKLPADL